MANMPILHEQRQHVPDVAEVDDRGGQQQGRAHRDLDLDDEEQRCDVRGLRGCLGADREQQDEDDRRNHHVEQGDDDGGEREDLARAVHLVEQRAVGHDRVGALGDRGHEERPAEQADIAEERVRRAVRLGDLVDVADALEDDREDRHEHDPA
ncbi:hypothetical protein ACU686_04060 [Yinghuangia aomiensis]